VRKLNFPVLSQSIRQFKAISEGCTETTSFVEVSKNLARYRSKNIFVIDHQNNYVERLSIDDNAAKFFHIHRQPV